MFALGVKMLLPDMKIIQMQIKIAFQMVGLEQAIRDILIKMVI